jgi:hypothetical protein
MSVPEEPSSAVTVAEPFSIPFAHSLVLAVLGPVAIGGIIAARAGALSPIAVSPAIVFGVLCATAPALYIAIAALGDAPPFGAVVRAMGTALGAFGIALAGLVLPATFLSLSATTSETTMAACSVALAGAGGLAVWRLARELETRSLAGTIVFLVWACATLGIAARLWWHVGEVLP